MVDVQHANLTGASLHEPKGVDAAAANRVYVSDGVGSGAWGQVTAAVLDEGTRAFENSLLHLQHLEANGTDGGTLTASTWNKRTLNQEVTNEIAGAAVASSVISLPVGDYIISAQTSVSGVGASRLRLRNTTDGTTLLIGPAVRNTNTAVATDGLISTLTGKFTLAGTKNLELQAWASITRNNTGMGIAASTGESEIYADVMIWKVD